MAPTSRSLKSLFSKRKSSTANGPEGEHSSGGRRIDQTSSSNSESNVPHLSDSEKTSERGDRGMQAPGAITTDADESKLVAADSNNGLVHADTQDTLAAVRTVSRVPGNNTYYEKGGLRTYGDGMDHIHEEPMTFKRFMIFVAMGFLWTGSQIPVYLFGGIIPLIEQDIGGADRYVWILLGNLIPLATITPFVGALSDLMGRRNLCLVSSVISIIGCTVCATAHTMNTFIAGQVLIGTASGVLELTALAVAGESAPTKKRGLYIGGIIVTIVPYCPSVVYAQLVASRSTWRYVGLWCGLWSFVGGVLTAFFYWPPPRANHGGLARREVLKRIDYVGGLTSAGGLTLFLAGLTWAGNQYDWTSAHVLGSLITGSILIVMFIVWEIFFVKHPMFPRRLGTNPRALTVILIITFASGANFFAVLVFWPTQYFAVYAGTDPVTVGIGSLPVGFCIIGGSIIFSVLISVFKGKVRLMMIISCCIMTVGNGSMAALTRDNLNHGGYAAVVFACLGVGAVIVPSQIYATVICPDDLIASITALTISARIVGGAIGYAAYYHVLRNNFIEAAFKYIAPTIIKAGVLSPLEFYHIVLAISGNLQNLIGTFPAIDTPEKVAAVIESGQLAFADAFHDVYYVSIAFGGVAIIASLFLPNIDKLMDSHVAVQYNKRTRQDDVEENA